MENVVTVIFDVESEAYKAFSEIRAKPFGEGYAVAEAALLKREEAGVTVLEAFDAAAVTSDDTATGMIVGSLVGILGGPLGVLLGASTGALVGSAYDTADAAGSMSMLEITESVAVPCSLFCELSWQPPSRRQAAVRRAIVFFIYFIVDFFLSLIMPQGYNSPAGLSMFTSHES